MTSPYEVPSWAGKPPTGLHLDVLKDDKLIQKLMIDEKKCYLFGRNAQLNDFCIDHASCSRVHAAFIYHKQLNIAYLVDLGSTHGTFIGTLRLESHKPTQLQINSTFHFGASTRRYILRERPSAGIRTTNIMEDIPMNETNEGQLLGLPESQTELDNLTEYNTAHNRRISMLGIADDTMRKGNKGSRKRRGVTFNEEEIIINPEDVDPNVGRFRNLIQSTVVPTKKLKLETSMGLTLVGGNHQFTSTSSTSSAAIPLSPTSMSSMASSILSSTSPTSVLATQQLYHGLPAVTNDHNNSGNLTKLSSSMDVDVTPIAMGTKLGLLLPNPAPDVTPTTTTSDTNDDDGCNETSITNVTLLTSSATSKATRFDDHSLIDSNSEPQKKKYAKEAWPGRKPMLGGL